MGVSKCRSPGPGAPASPGKPSPVSRRTMLRSAALASGMVEASTPMRSPFTRPASPIKARTQSKTASVDFMGLEARAGLRQPGMVRHPFTAPQSQELTVCSDAGNPSKRHSRPRSESMPSKPMVLAHQVHAEIAPGRLHRGRAHPGRVIEGRQLALGKGVEAALGSAPTVRRFRKTHDPASAASPPWPPSSPPDDPSCCPIAIGESSGQIRTSKNR